MQARSIAPLAATCALVPLLFAGALSGFTSTPGLAQGLSQQALLQTTQTPVATRTSTPTPIPQATATPTLAPTLAAGSLATPTPVTSSIPSTSLSGTSATVSATPLIASLVATPFAPAVSSGVTSTVPVSTAVPSPSQQGLPPSAIFVQGGTVTPFSSTTTTSDPASVASTNLAGPFDQVIDATLGGSLALPDRSLQLAVPAGVANTDFVLVSLTEVGPSSASGNLQVGNRVFALNVVDSGGLTVTNFGTPILVTASASAPRATGPATRGIAALDPTSGQFSSITTDAPSGQLVGSLDKLAAPATTSVPDAGLNIASTRGSRTAAAPQPQQQRQPQSAGGGSSADPANILAALGLAP
jgi:hypothetical protein